MSDIFDGLKAIVQYRRKPERGCDVWHNMAAFDLRGVAERYAASCGGGDQPWEYQVVDVPDTAAD